MISLGNIRDFLFVLIAVYFSQGWLYANGSIIAKVVLFMIMVISGFFFIKSLLQKRNKNLFFLMLTVLIILNVFGFILSGHYNWFNRFKTILTALLPFYPFYYFAQKGVLREKDLRNFFLVILPVFIFNFYLSKESILMRLNLAEDASVVNNEAYRFVFILPFLFAFNQKKLLSFLVLFVILFFVIQGAKRGALIAGLFGTIIFAFYQLRIEYKNSSFKDYIVPIISLSALTLFFLDFYQNNDFLVARMNNIEKGEWSNRDMIYTNLFNAWYYSDNFIHILFGFGFGESRNLSGSGHWAHSDWLELLSNYGIFGITVYLLMFLSAIKYAGNKMIEKNKRFMMLTIISIWVVTSSISMNYTSDNGLFQSVLLAYLFGTNNFQMKYPKSIPHVKARGN